MNLLATYTDDHRPSIVLTDTETEQVLHTIEPTADTRASLLWRAQNWATQHGHTITDIDRSNLT